jgi:hypothetical protein
MSNRRSLTPQIIEIDGDRYANLKMAQAAALADVAQAVAQVVRAGLAQEKLTVVDGKVTFTDAHKDEQA